MSHDARSYAWGAYLIGAGPAIRSLYSGARWSGMGSSAANHQSQGFG